MTQNEYVSEKVKLYKKEAEKIANEDTAKMMAASFGAGMYHAFDHPNWHKYPDETPEPEKPVLCYTAKGTYVVAWQREKLIGGKPSGKYEWSRWNVPIIAWTELPKPPKFD